MGEKMITYEYEITKYPSDRFKQIVYFCTDQGECSFDQLPHDEMNILGEILNEKGAQGWELIQLVFGNEGILAFWKKAV